MPSRHFDMPSRHFDMSNRHFEKVDILIVDILTVDILMYTQVNTFKSNFAMEISNVILKRREVLFRRTSNVFKFSSFLYQYNNDVPLILSSKICFKYCIQIKWLSYTYKRHYFTKGEKRKKINPWHRTIASIFSFLPGRLLCCAVSQENCSLLNYLGEVYSQLYFFKCSKLSF